MESKKIGSFIAAQRKLLSMTQQELAYKLNLTNRAVSKWETGDGYPDIAVLPALTEILDITIDELLKGEKNESEPRTTRTPDVKEYKQQASFLLENSVRHFSNLYLVSLSIVLAGIVASALSLGLYDHIFLTSLIYALIISLSFLIIGMMFYINICKNLKAALKNTTEWRSVKKWTSKRSSIINIKYSTQYT